MEMRPEITLAQKIDDLQQDVADLKEDVTAALHFIKGNGDPTKGLLWLVADLTRLLATNTQLIEAHRAYLEKHKTEADERFAKHLVEAHKKERSAFWENVKDSATRTVVNGTVIALLAIFVYGVTRWIQNGGRF